MTYRWILRSVEEKRDTVARLQHELNNLPEPLARSLVLRGVETFEQARHFFRPSLEAVHDPFLMCDMHEAANRVVQAIERKERVLVYGDYDVDGTTSAALMVTFLRDMGIDALSFIPHRYRDGYGLKKIGMDYAVNAGVSLVIALDCGITGHEVADYAQSKNLDLIICDHHTAGDTIPNAVAVLDPKRPGCSYPFKELSGCGVGFKLVQATLHKLGEPVERAYPYLDLVALSIASDIVPVLGENRLLITAGLDMLRNNPRLGIRKLAEKARLDLRKCSTSQIVFAIGPRINAAGRLDHARLAVDLLTTTNAGEAQALANKIEQINQRRRKLDRSTFKAAVNIAEASCDTCMQHALVLHHDDWHLGVIGIVASRLVERFHRPAIMLATVNGTAKGSARSILGFNVYNAIKACEPLLTQFGGHKYAAGMELPLENVEPFREKFNSVVSDMMRPELMEPELPVDAPLDLGDITPRFWRVLAQFGPFGPQNNNPLFLSRNLRVVGHPAIVGDGHLKFRVAPATNGMPPFDVIGFKMHHHMPTVRASVQQGTGLQMVFSIEENTWAGKTALQLKLKDLRPES